MGGRRKYSGSGVDPAIFPEDNEPPRLGGGGAAKPFLLWTGVYNEGGFCAAQQWKRPRGSGFLLTVLTPCGRCMLRDGWLGVKRKFEKNAFAGRNRREPDAPAPACPPAWHGRLLAPVCVRVLSRFGCLLPHCLRWQTMRLPGTARGRPNVLLESLLQSIVGVVRGGKFFLFPSPPRLDGGGCRAVERGAVLSRAACAGRDYTMVGGDGQGKRPLERAFRHMCPNCFLQGVVGMQ